MIIFKGDKIIYKMRLRIPFSSFLYDKIMLEKVIKIFYELPANYLFSIVVPYSNEDLLKEKYINDQYPDN